MSRTQTLNYKHTHKEREIKIYEIRQDTYILSTGERNLYMIYIRLQEGYKILWKLSPEINLLNGFTSSIYREEKKSPKQL